MCNFTWKDKSCWIQLDDNIIYYQSGYKSYQDQRLRIKNVQTDETKQFNIIPICLGLLSKQNSYLTVFIQTHDKIIFAQLDITSLKLKIKYRFCQGLLFHRTPAYDSNNNIFRILFGQQLIQTSRNKLIRTQKGKIEKLLPKSLIIIMGIKQINNNYVGFEDQFFQQFKILFQNSLNINFLYLEQKYGQYLFKKLGDFLIIKQHKDYWKKTQQQSIHYLSIDGIMSGGQLKGKINLRQNETLKMIKCFNSHLYAVFKQDFYCKVYIIKSENERELIYSVIGNEDIKKLILMQNYLIYTDGKNRLNPQILVLEDQRIQQMIR